MYPFFQSYEHVLFYESYTIIMNHEPRYFHHNKIHKKATLIIENRRFMQPCYPMDAAFNLSPIKAVQGLEVIS